MDDKCRLPELCAIAETKFDEMEKRWLAMFESQQTAIDKSETILAIRLEEMNNFRKQIEKERADFTTRRETVLLNFVISILVVAVGCFITYALAK